MPCARETNHQMEGYTAAVQVYLSKYIILKDQRQSAASRTISQVQRFHIKKLRKGVVRNLLQNVFEGRTSFIEGKKKSSYNHH